MPQVNRSLKVNFFKKYKKIPVQQNDGSTASESDCYSDFLQFTQSIPVRDEEIEYELPGSYIEPISQVIPKSDTELLELQEHLYTTYHHCGEMVAYDDWLALENACNSTDFLRIKPAIVTKASKSIIDKLFKKKSKDTSKNNSKKDSENLNKSSRLADIDVPYSVKLTIIYLEKAKNLDSKQEIRDALIFYTLAFHLSKLLFEEAYLSLSERAMLLLGNYNIFRIICHIQPLWTKARFAEYNKLYKVKKPRGRQIAKNTPTEEPVTPKAEKKNQSDEALAMQRVLDNATIMKPEVPMEMVIGQEAAFNLIHNNLIAPTTQIINDNTVCGERKKLRGLLLYGPPGNGKTLLAQAAASSAKGMTFISMDVSQIQSKWRGMCDATIRSLFKVASENAPALVFIDELESLCANRSDTEVESNNSTVATMLVESQKYDDVFFMGATNKPWTVDSAFYRRMVPIYVKMPTEEERYEMIRRTFLNLISTLTHENLKDIAKATSGFSFDDLNNFISRCNDLNELNSRAAKFYKATFQCKNGTDQICACKPDDPNAIPLEDGRVHELLLNILPVSLQEVLEIMKECPPTVDLDEIKLYNKFAKDAMSGFKKFMDEQKLQQKKEYKCEYYTGFNRDIEKGKFNQRRRSKIYRSFKVPGFKLSDL